MMMFDNFVKRMRNHTASTDEHRHVIINASDTAKAISFNRSPFYRLVTINGKEYPSRFYKASTDSVKSGMGYDRIEFEPNIYFDAGTYVQVESQRSHNGQIHTLPEQWLILNSDDDWLFPKNMIKRCNYNLKWKNSDGEVIERWAIIDDSYKMYSAFQNYNHNMTQLPSSTLVVWLPRDSETINIQRDDRFLVDATYHDGRKVNPSAYKVSNRNVITKSYPNLENYNAHGIVMLALYEDQFNPAVDNSEAMIANYITEEHTSGEIIPPDPSEGMVAKFRYEGNDVVIAGAKYKKFTFLLCDWHGYTYYPNSCKIEVRAFSNGGFEYNAQTGEYNANGITYKIDGGDIYIKCNHQAIIGTTLYIDGAFFAGTECPGLNTLQQSYYETLAVKVVNGI